jgi:hypothetical protein
MSSTDFTTKRRQAYLSEESFLSTLQELDDGEKLYRQDLEVQNIPPRNRATMLHVIAEGRWNSFQLKYTAGESLTQLAESLAEVVDGFEDYVAAGMEVPDDLYVPAFPMTDMIDIYIDYLHLLCFAILLRREDLIPRIHSMIEGTEYDEDDAVIEHLLGFYLPERPDLYECYWDKPYGKLLDAIDCQTPVERAAAMKKYVKNWYRSMKGQAAFWGKHEQIEPDFTPYFGYWAFCSAAFTYLYDIDDSGYRDELVYPKDLVEYARSVPRFAPTLGAIDKAKRVPGGELCPASGYWFTPAKEGSRAHFKSGDLMPIFDAAKYGATIWQWSEEQ